MFNNNLNLSSNIFTHSNKTFHKKPAKDKNEVIKALFYSNHNVFMKMIRVRASCINPMIHHDECSEKRIAGKKT